MSFKTTSQITSRKSGGLRDLRKFVYGQRRRLATFTAGLLTVAVGYHVVFGQNGLTVYEEKRQHTVALHQQLEMLSRENEALKSHVELLQTDPTSIEHQAREELHYTKPGEVIVTSPVSTEVNTGAGGVGK